MTFREQYRSGPAKVCYWTYVQRRRKGWSCSEARLAPPVSHSEAGRLGAISRERQRRLKALLETREPPCDSCPKTQRVKCSAGLACRNFLTYVQNGITTKPGGEISANIYNIAMTHGL